MFHPVAAGELAENRQHWWSTAAPAAGRTELRARQAYAEVLVVFGVFFAASVAAAGFSLAATVFPPDLSGWSEAIPNSIDQVATTVLCVLVPVLLAARRGSGPGDLGLLKPGTVSLSVGIRIAAWALLAIIVGAIVTSALATGQYPQGPFSYPALTFNLFHAAQAGFIEEVVVLAFVVTTLEQARRPRKEIVAVALLLRLSYHIYYGPGVAGILIWAVVFLWLFLRFRTIVPLILVHSLWDIQDFLDARWHLVGAATVLVSVALFVSALTLWLVERFTKTSPAALAVAPPGWYPDPAAREEVPWYEGWDGGPAGRQEPPSNEQEPLSD